MSMPTIQRLLAPVAGAFLAVAALTPSVEAQRARRVSTAPDVSRELRDLERGVLAELNRARENPRAYAAMLDSMVGWYEGKLLRRPGAGIVFETVEGAPAVREASSALRRMASMPAFEHADGLSRAARDHVRDQGPRGRMGHRGGDGSSTADRVERHGKWRFVLSENIAYGPLDARGMVVGLIVDDGVPDRGHRRNIFDPRVRVAGVSCGEHKVYERMCVVVHAGGFADRSERADAER